MVGRLFKVKEVTIYSQISEDEAGICVGYVDITI